MNKILRSLASALAWILRGLASVIKPKTPKDDELFDGVPKPSSLLAGMIVTKLLSPEFSPKDSTAHFPGFTVSWWQATPDVITSPTGFKNHPRLKAAIKEAGFSFSTQDYALNAYPALNRSVNKYIMDHYPIREVKVTGLGVVFSDKEKVVILDGLFKAMKLYREREDAKKESENQMKAVSAIEAFFKTNEKE